MAGVLYEHDTMIALSLPAVNDPMPDAGNPMLDVPDVDDPTPDVDDPILDVDDPGTPDVPRCHQAQVYDNLLFTSSNDSVPAPKSPLETLAPEVFSPTSVDILSLASFTEYECAIGFDFIITPSSLVDALRSPFISPSDSPQPAFEPADHTLY